MLWFFLAFATAFFSATESALVKRWFSDLPAMEMACFSLAYSLPFFALALALIPKPTLDPAFWPSMAYIVPLNASGFLLTIMAIKRSPLSLTMPFFSLTPAIVLGTGFLFLGEVPSPIGAAGVLALAAGGYVLNLNLARPADVLGPFRAIARERGSLYVILAATVYGFTAALGKVLIQQSAPLYAASTFFLVHNAGLLALLFATRLARPSILLTRPRAGVVVGATMFCHIFCHYASVALVAVAYMIAIKRLNGLISVIYGGVLFKETNMRFRLAGAALMSAGAAVIALFG